MDLVWSGDALTLATTRLPAGRRVYTLDVERWSRASRGGSVTGRITAGGLATVLRQKVQSVRLAS